MVSMTHHHTMQFLDSLHNWNSIMNTFILGQDVLLILLFMILLMSNNENIITVCLPEPSSLTQQCLTKSVEFIYFGFPQKQPNNYKNTMKVCICLLSVFFSLLSVIVSLLSVIVCLLSVIVCLLSVVDGSCR